MFRLVTPPIIRSTYNCTYSIWHWSNLRKCSVWSQLKMRGMDSSLLPSAIVWSRKVAETVPYLSSLADFTHCIFLSLTSARCCKYSYMCPWWWVELPPETCRAVYRNIIKCTYSQLVGQLLTLNYHYSLSNNPEECSSHLLGGESLKSRNEFMTSQNLTTVLIVLVTSADCDVT
jgi:hypothetical protein